MGKPSENRFIAGEMRLSRPKQNCTRVMQKTIGRAISSAAETVGVQLGAVDLFAVDVDVVLRGLEPEAVADLHFRQQKAQVLGQRLAHAAHPRRQRRTGGLVDQADQLVAERHRQPLDQRNVFPGQRLRALLVHGLTELLDLLEVGTGGRRLVQRDAPSDKADQRGEAEECQMRHAWHHAEHEEDAGDGVQRGRVGQQLALDLAGDVAGFVDAGNDDRRRGGQEQRRNLRHQAVTDGQQRVLLEGFAGSQVVDEYTDGETAEEVDQQNQDAGNGIATDELRGTVHRAVEVGFLGHLLAPCLGIFLSQQAGIEVGVDSHLLARQGVQGEARGDFRDALAALGDDDEVDDHQDHEHHQADDEVAADHHLAESLDHLARRAGAGMAFEQHNARRGDV